MYQDLFATVGLLWILKSSFQLIHWFVVCGLRTYLWTRFFHDKDFPKRFGGTWAVVTGASEGIGRAYAFKLAERKMNIFLISRSEDKLRKVTKDLMKLYNVQARYYPLDCETLGQEENFSKFQNELESLDIGILVNNVGQMYEKLQYFLTVSKRDLEKVLTLNITTTVLMTKAILPQMVTRRNGVIVNIGSGSSVHPTPLMTVYSAAKRFVDEFTAALQYEYRNSGVIFQLIQPFYVSTNLTNCAKPNFFVTHPNAFVESAVRTIGISTRNYGYWSHGLFGMLGELLPERFYMFCSIHVNSRLYEWLTGVKVDLNKKVD